MLPSAQESNVGAGVAQAGDAERVGEHFAGELEIPVAVVHHRYVEQFGAVAGHQCVVEGFVGVYAQPGGFGRHTGLG